jgi:hypothetical protein
MTTDNRTGGSYAVIDGVLRQVEAPTVDHPEGNRPRDAQGKPLDVPGQAPAPAEAPAPEPVEKPKRFFGKTE